MDAPTRAATTRAGTPASHRPDADSLPDSGRLLIGEGEPAPYEIVNPDGRAPLLLVCDHASTRIPARLGTLGLPPAALGLHIAYDIGAASLTRLLAGRLDAPAVLCGYSRLVIDCNRQPGDPQSILAVSDGIVIPGNEALSAEEQEARAEAILWPYHHAIEQVFTRLRRRGPEPLLFSVHTFTPTLGGEDRFWDASVLWNRDPRLAVPLINFLRRHEELNIGDNEPYSGRDIAYTLNLHAGAAGLANAAIEVRQDHCETDRQIHHWADLIADALRQLLSMGNLHRIEQF
ncbi:MAG: N-formylglutamate amidohydrolase [Rhodospirillales bacterium]|nr:N-formylglutamate amidohydrolase [Rhodospirillales bacterium]